MQQNVTFNNEITYSSEESHRLFWAAAILMSNNNNIFIHKTKFRLLMHNIYYHGGLVSALALFIKLPYFTASWFRANNISKLV